MDSLIKLHSILTNAYIASGMNDADAAKAALAEMTSGALTPDMKANIIKAGKVVR